ncbi:tyrosine recombinase XerS [Virgibacillus sp. 6R]|uniref:tyrosine recombinase XerS n=1 Tax=Metabacillus niabensis TaxID=324854 RepID=UPI0016428360
MPTPNDIYLYEKRIEEMLPLFPFYIKEYIDAQDTNNRSVTTRLGYLHEFKTFFNWLLKDNDALTGSYSAISEIPYEELEKLSLKAVERYLDFLKKENLNEGKPNTYTIRRRKKPSINRNISALKSLFNYLTTKTEKDDGECYFYRNVMQKIDFQKDLKTANSRARKISSDILHDDKIREFIDFLKYDYEHTLDSTRKLNHFIKNKERDIAIISLFLGTGLRVSELASIEMTHIDFKELEIDVVRKGSIEDTVEVLPLAMDDLMEYLAIREKRYKVPKNFPFVFVSVYGKETKAISVRTIQNLVDTYSKAFTGGKALSPHKLRHSYASEYISRGGGNIILLRDQLGHSSIETTSKYTNLSKEERKEIVRKMNDRRLGIDNEGNEG